MFIHKVYELKFWGCIDKNNYYVWNSWFDKIQNSLCQTQYQWNEKGKKKHAHIYTLNYKETESRCTNEVNDLRIQLYISYNIGDMWMGV